MFKCRCGMNIDDEMANSVCPRCGMQYPGWDYQAAHIPAREEAEPVSNVRYMRRCPECKKGELIPSEGCSMCPVCGYSPCSG